MFTTLLETYHHYRATVPFDLIWENTKVTLVMLGSAWFFTILFGLMLGVILFLTSPNQLLANRYLYPILSLTTNVVRSIPFVILVVALLPITPLIMGTAYGVKGAIFPLIVGSAPFFAKLTETALREVDRGVIEAAQSMGAPLRTIIFRVLLPEARPSIIAGISITGILLLSFTAMASVIGGNGLGAIAINLGFHRNQTELTNIVLLIVILLAQTIQFTGDRLMLHYTRR